MTDTLPLVIGAPGDFDADEVYDNFVDWAGTRGFTLYPAQDEAVIAIVSGSNVVLSTPTGTGKSLVAIAAHFAAMAEGKRSFYTAPIKALVSEKFFALVEVFGAERVGMVTGDSKRQPRCPDHLLHRRDPRQPRAPPRCGHRGRPGRDGRVPLLLGPGARLGLAGAPAHPARRAVHRHVRHPR